jgi:hypothetical protein
MELGIKAPLSPTPFIPNLSFRFFRTIFHMTAFFSPVQKRAFTPLSYRFTPLTLLLSAGTSDKGLSEKTSRKKWENPLLETLIRLKAKAFCGNNGQVEKLEACLERVRR